MTDPEITEIAALLRDPAMVAFHSLNQELLKTLTAERDLVNEIGERWRKEYLERATREADPLKADDYARPLITLAETLRMCGRADVARRVYARSIQLIDQEALSRQTRLHRGALLSNLAICDLLAGRHTEGIAWLYAAAEEDRITYGIADVRESYALSAGGIIGQWLDRVLTSLPPRVLEFVTRNLEATLSPNDVRGFCLWSAKQWDLRIATSMVEYDSVNGKTDMHSSSVRLSVLRELASYFEVLWRRLGSLHVDPGCATRISPDRALANLICHMHYLVEDPKKRAANTALRASKTTGLLWNSIKKHDALLDAIEGEIAQCNREPLDLAWRRLSTETLSPDPKADAVAKRYLLAYKLRNVTSHTFEPGEGTVMNAHKDLYEWMLQAIIYLYFSLVFTGQVRV